MIDETHLGGRFDIRIELSIGELFPRSGSSSATSSANDPEAAPAASDPIGAGGIITAVHKLGLKLDKVRGTIDAIVIDQIGRPSEN